MKLKCIGGPNDGEYGNTRDDKPRVGECVQMRIARQYLPKIDDFIPKLSYERIAEEMTDIIVMYIVDRDCDGLFLRVV
jgi:hypothetical protein